MKQSRKAPRLSWVLLVAVAAIALWNYAAPRPADPTLPLTVVGQQYVNETPQQSLRIASFNIHSGKGSDGVRDLSRTVDCLRELDFAGLYEVKSFGYPGGECQAHLLGDRLNAASVFVPTVRRWGQEGFGNALLTRVPLTSLQRIPLPGTQPKRSRNAILASLQLDGTTVHILATHLDTSIDRSRQLRAVADLFLSLQEPAVLMGDFNTLKDDPVLQALLKAPGVDNALSDYFARSGQAQSIDWILTRGLECIAAEQRQTDASDHPILWAELRLPENGTKSNGQTVGDVAAENEKSELR